MDRLDAMQVLLAVVDEGSLSAGSRKLRAPLPSVSRKVAELERHLGTRLLIRTSRNVQLTDAGRDYVDAARNIVAQIEDAEQRASGEYEVPRGELTVTAMIEFGRILVVPLTAEFLEEHPEVTLNFLALDRVVQLIDERVDIGVRIGSLGDSSLFATKVGHVEMVSAASPDYLERKGRPARPEDLIEHDGVSFEPLKERWIYSCDGRKIEAQPNVRLKVNTGSAALAAAVAGVGITRLPTYQMANELRSGALVPLLCDFDQLFVPVHLAYVRQGLLPLKVRAFLDWMAPRMRRKLQELNALGRPPALIQRA